MCLKQTHFGETTMKPIHIAMATDHNYLDYALAACASMLKYTSRDIVLHLLHEELTGADLARFEALPRNVAFTLQPHKIENAFFKGWPPLRWSVSCYYRLILPELLPELDKILYLDCDLLVLDDIGKLYDLDLQGKSCAGAATKLKPEHYDRIGLDRKYAYFNSGVMLFDLAKMYREHHIERFIRLFNEMGDRIKYPDQDILNLAYAEDHVKLPLRWNLMTSVYRNPPDNKLYSLEETIAALKDPAICHFTGTHKPWRFRATTHHPYGFAYPYFAALAGWPSSRVLKLKLKACWFTGILKKPKLKVPWGPDILKPFPELRHF